MTTVCEPNKCNGCMACIDKCLENCITIVDNIYAYNAVKDMNRCINCGQCEKVCPNNSPVYLKSSVEWKQGWAEKEIRQSSSSGGAASAIIKSFIQSGGYVASCLFKDGQFLFEITNDLEVAKKFAGSKYVKSNPAGIYKKIRERLKTDKVLFIGLPCQVAVLKNYINNQKDLYTIDLICHGTPSPKILEKYLHEYGYELPELKDINFRNKSDFGVKSKGITKLEKGMDPYLIAFLNSIDYTENCYSCIFATKERVSDITLGDSWGTEYKDEEKNGISLMLIQTDKGRELIKNARLKLKNVDYEKAVKANHQLNHPCILKPERNEFIKMVSDGKTVKQATYKTLPKEVLKQKVKYFLIQLGIVKTGGGYQITVIK